MALLNLIQILKLNDAREGVKDGREWKMQDAECVIFDQLGNPDQVGVLMIPKDMFGKVQPGVFMAEFKLRADTRKEGGRRIGAELVGLVPSKLPASKV